MVLDSPDLAACVVLSPGWWEVVRPPAALPDVETLGREVASRLTAALGRRSDTELTVFVAAVKEGAPAAVASGPAALLLVPDSPRPSAAGLAQTLAQAIVASRLTPAAPDPRCSEPLLALAEAFVHAGSHSLATLPTNLRPVGEWLEDDEAAAALRPVAEAALDDEKPWPTRQAALVQLARPGGAAPALAHAAALLVEISGDPAHLLERPLDLLLEWHGDREKDWPSMPRALKRSLARPFDAGMATKPSPSEQRELHTSALNRAIEAGNLPPLPPDKDIVRALRNQAAAAGRALGSNVVCRWLTGDDLPAGLRTGCRDDGEGGGLVYVRPTRRGAFEVTARAPSGVEAVLVRWPRWALFPSILAQRGELAFIDREGIWTVALDASRAPRLLAQGTFRHLAPAPDGESMAVARWPSGQVVIVSEEGVRETGLAGRGGMAWVAPDVLLASDGERLRLGSASGDTRETGVVVPFTSSLTVKNGVPYLLGGAAGEWGLFRVQLGDDTVERRVRLPYPSLGLVVTDDGAAVGGGATLWSWRSGQDIEQAGAGLTPGPG